MSAAAPKPRRATLRLVLAASAGEVPINRVDPQTVTAAMRRGLVVPGRRPRHVVATPAGLVVADPYFLKGGK